MSVSRVFLEHCAAETGFAVPALEKVVRLGEVAGDLGRHPVLGSALALKGGTALNLCFGTPTRLSVDLDLNVVAHAEREAMRASRPGIEVAVEELARRRGYAVQRSADAFAGRKIYLGYTSVLENPDRIEIDLNYLFRVPVAGVEMRQLWQPGGLDPPHILAVSLDELCIGKLLAFLERAAVRDLWDVARLPRFASSVLGSPAFRARFLALSATLDHPLMSYTRDHVLGQLTERAVRNLLAPMLVGGTTPTVEVLREDAWAVVAPLVALAPAEETFVAAVQQGEFRPALLPPESAEIVRALEGHPAIQWKLQNARAYRRRQRAALPPSAGSKKGEA